MRIQYASDLHLEFPENEYFLSKNPLVPEGDILILAGDIIPFSMLDRHLDFFKCLSDQFENVYWIPGNHEYYHSDLQTDLNQVNEKLEDNVNLVNKKVFSF